MAFLPKWAAFAALVAVTSVVAPSAFANEPIASLAGDVKKGEVQFKKLCQNCHMVGENAKHRLGPILNGVVGRTAGTVADYKYSKPMIAAGEGGLVWTPEALTEYLLHPKETVEKNKMAFAGVKDPAIAADIIAFLATHQ